MAKQRVYWDACIWFALIKDEPGRVERCRSIIELAKAGEVEIWTSSLTLAEVFRKKCGDGPAVGLAEDQDKAFEDFLEQAFIVEAQVDRPVGVRARRLLRAHSQLKKPADAIHLATAAWNNLDEFHTFDAVNLLCLDGLVATREGKTLRICEPPAPPPKTLDLFEQPLMPPVADSAAQAPTGAPLPDGANQGLVDLPPHDPIDVQKSKPTAGPAKVLPASPPLPDGGASEPAAQPSPTAAPAAPAGLAAAVAPGAPLSEGPASA